MPKPIMSEEEFQRLQNLDLQNKANQPSALNAQPLGSFAAPASPFTIAQMNRLTGTGPAALALYRDAMLALQTGGMASGVTAKSFDPGADGSSGPAQKEQDDSDYDPYGQTHTGSQNGGSHQSAYDQAAADKQEAMGNRDDEEADSTPAPQAASLQASAVTSSGLYVVIVGMESSGANATVRTQDGRVIPLSQVKFGDMDIGSVYKAASKTPDAGTANRYLQEIRNRAKSSGDYFQAYQGFFQDAAESAATGKNDYSWMPGKNAPLRLSSDPRYMSDEALAKADSASQQERKYSLAQDNASAGSQEPAPVYTSSNEKAKAQVSKFYNDYAGLPSTRVHTIVVDTQKKLAAPDLSAEEKMAIIADASSRANDQNALQLIGKNMWFGDEAYPLYDPREHTDGPRFEPVYETVLDDAAISRGIDLAGAIGGLSLEDGEPGVDFTKSYTKGQGGAIAGVNLLSSFVNNAFEKEVKIVLQETSDGRKRAVLRVASSDMQNRMSQLAGTTQYMATNALSKSGWYAYWNAQDTAASLYKQATGKVADKKLDLKMTFDPKHKEDGYYGYIVGEEDGTLSYVSPVYPGDRLEIVESWGTETMYDLTDWISPLSTVQGGLGDLRTSLGKIGKKYTQGQSN